MDYESICASLQTISAARMFYEYGKLDRLLERGITISSDDLYEIYYELLIAATDYLDENTTSPTNAITGISAFAV